MGIKKIDECEYNGFMFSAKGPVLCRRKKEESVNNATGIKDFSSRGIKEFYKICRQGKHLGLEADNSELLLVDEEGTIKAPIMTWHKK